MQTTEPAVCNLDVFGTEFVHFWMSPLTGLLEKLPELEYPHKQNFYMLLYIEDADGKLIVDKESFRLDKAKIIVTKPGCIISLDINRSAIGKILCFTEDFFSLRYNNNILYRFSFLKHREGVFIRISGESKSHWDSLISLMNDEYQLQKRETEKVLRSYLNIILFEVERAYKPGGAVKTINHRHQKLQQFELLIEKYFDKKKLPSAYADMLHVSPNYLNRLCRQESGVTAGDLIRKRIFIEAQRLLHYTSYSVSEIADKLGFENPAYFITFFKKLYGSTPEQFRKKQLL